MSHCETQLSERLVLRCQQIYPSKKFLRKGRPLGAGEICNASAAKLEDISFLSDSEARSANIINDFCSDRSGKVFIDREMWYKYR